MKLTLMSEYAELGIHFLIGAAISIGGITMSALSVARIIALAKNAK